MSLAPVKCSIARRRDVCREDGWQGTIFVVLLSRTCRPDSVIQSAIAPSPLCN